MSEHLKLHLFLLFALLHQVASYSECKWDVQCEELYLPGSKCMSNGMCSNPFSAGCLRNYHTRTNTGEEFTQPRKRVCNSDDEEGSGSCEPSPFGYPEIRVHNGDWESPIFYSWILQIFLSEFLNVPVTVGLGVDTQEASFYNIDSIMTWSAQSYAFDALKTANAMGGRCDLTDEPCVHVLPEVWIGQEKKFKNFLSEGHIDQVSWDGQVGKISWYIPVATALRYPWAVSHHGLSGNREELAKIFKRPTNWGDYCAEVSATGCQVPDDVAARPPEEGEEGMYFLEGLFTGYFRLTDENDCTAHPDTCTGHIVDAPCSWDTNTDAQAYHNNIALQSSGPLKENRGYAYAQMIEIWRAANATGSDVIMWWWMPDATIEEFQGTEYEFQQVLLPAATFECRQARAEPETRCSLDQDVRRGPPGGGCDNEANSLQTVIAFSLRQNTYDTPEVDRSPGYQAIRNLKVSQLDMNTILEKWVAGGRSGYAAREAICTWVAEHEVELQSYIPVGFPRLFVEDDSYDDPLLDGAVGFAMFAISYVMAALMLVYAYRNTKVFVYAQVPFILMLLVGLLLVSVGSLFSAMEPQDTVCIAQSWLISLGYTVELVPLLVKVAAINRLMAATKRMRRIEISISSLFVTVASIIVLVAIFMTSWTLVNPPHRSGKLHLLNDSEIVTSLTCASGAGIWEVIILCWNGLLIICASVLAFQSRSLKEEFNESQSLGTMIYSHAVLTTLYIVVWSMGTGPESDYPTIQPSILAAAESFILSFDVVSAITIYIMPKVLAARKPTPKRPNADSNKEEKEEKDVPERLFSTNKHSRSPSSKNFSGVSPSGSSSMQSSDHYRRTGGPRTASLPSIEENELSEMGSSDCGERSIRDLGATSALPVPAANQQERYTSDVDYDSEDEADSGGPRFARVTVTGSIYNESDKISPNQKGSNGAKSSTDVGVEQAPNEVA